MNRLFKASTSAGYARGLRFFFLLFFSLTATAFADVAAEETGSISGDIFGSNAKWVHAFLSLGEAYDDNIFNTQSNTESDAITIVSPGIQLMVPATDQKAEDIETGTTTPGGLVFGRFHEPSFRRLRAYVGYAPQLQYYADHPDENTVNHAVQGGLQLNLRGGFSFDVVNRFVRDYDRLEANTSTQTNQYDSNLFNLIATCPVTEKIQLRADFSNFWVNYTDADIDLFRNRVDTSVAGQIHYQFKPKTSVFMEYRQVHSDYESDATRNSDSSDILAGLVWDVTAKTRGSIRAGYDVRRYEDSASDASSGFVFLGNINYRISPKTRVGLRAFHRNEESSDIYFDYTRTTSAGINYLQKLTYKLDLNLDVAYRWQNYKSRNNALPESADRNDDAVDFASAFIYGFREWLSVSLGYQHRARNSSLDAYSFTGNIVMLNITGAI